MFRRPQTSTASPGPLFRLSRFLDGFRWAFMPLGLFALVAVGVHAAADTLDDRLLSLVDWLDSGFDRLVGRSRLTSPLVDLISLERRTFLARGVALVWELAADLVLALPALGYREEAEEDLARARVKPPRPSWRALVERCLRRPTTMRWVRPLATSAVVLAGACAVALSIQGTVYLSWRELFGDRAADGLARVLALGALVGILASLGGRAVRRSLEHADASSEAHARGRRQALMHGLVGSALVMPLALAAVLDASPVLSFLR